MISQSASDVRSFRPRGEVVEQIARDLEDNAEDPAALAARGELRLHSGETEAGLDDLRQAVAFRDDARSRQLLVTTLLDGLRADFADYRSHVDELDRLAVEPGTAQQLLDDLCPGTARMPARRRMAFEQYVRLLTEGDADATMDYTGDGRRVRRDRRVQGQIAQLYADAAPADQRRWTR